MFACAECGSTEHTYSDTPDNVWHCVGGCAMPIGTRVRFWPGLRVGPAKVSRTRSKIWLLGHGPPVVAVEGYAGGIALTHVEIIKEED